LWKSDGSAAGTVLVKDIRGGSSESTPGQLTALGSSLLLAANDGTTGLELWRSDGTDAGTTLVADLHPGSASSAPKSFAAAGGGIVLFVADDGTRGSELWRTDGTPAGTALVADLLPGPGSSSPASLLAVDGVVYFAATDGSHGRELWRSDGSAGGTWLVEDLAPGSASSSPAELALSGGRLYFSANGNGAKGEIFDRQLWALPLDCLPGEVSGLAIARNGASAELDWNAVGGATAYDVVRATSPAGFASGAVCLPAAGTTASDPAVPSPVFYYLVRARNACGAGTAGLASAGGPRDVIDCP
jgi:ELWxxDGT repeat protein